MTVSTIIVKNSYNGDSTTATFNFTFKVLANTELKVIIRSANATETIKTLNTHYSITGIGNANGGSITFTAGNIPSSTEQVVLIRETTQTQNIDYLSNDPFPAETHEEGLDKSIIITQELQEQINRSIKLSRTNTINSTEFSIGAANRAGKILGFDANGELVVSQELGSYAGVWVAATTYAARDIVKDSSNNNIYLCNTGHTSSGTVPISSNADSSKWDLIVDAASATASAAAAASSASAASTSASNAATSETNAATSLSSTQTIYDNFDDRFLGTKATNPTLDNDGNALIEGAIYYNSTDNDVRFYNGTSWDAPATQASTSATNAASSASSASTSASTATTQAGIATTQASNASTSASNAATSETNAAGSASAASTSASNASTSASAASTSASNASTSAATATTQASNASNSATAAAASAAAAAASADNFDDTYLGAKASNPSTDNDGDPLNAGDLYFNTTSSVLKYYDGSSWQSITPGITTETDPFAPAFAIALG